MSNSEQHSDIKYENLIREACLFLNNRSFTNMSDVCGEAVKCRPTRCEAYFLLSILAFLLDDLGQSIELAKKGHEYDPDCQEGNEILAHLLAHSGNIEESVFHAKLVSVGYPNLLLTGISIEGLDNLPKAMNEPQGASYKIDATRALTEGRYADAVLGFEKELRLRSGDSTLFRQFAEGLRGVGEPDRAIPAMHAAIQLDGNNYKNHLELGKAHLECGDQTMAFHCLNEALNRSNNNTHALAEISFLRNKIPFKWPAFDSRVRAWLKANIKTQKPVSHEKGVDKSEEIGGDRITRIGFLLDRATLCDALRILEPLLMDYDRFSTEVIVYSTDIHDDPVPKRLKDLVADWNNIANLSDQGLTNEIRNRELDILIDLCITIKGQRPGVISQRPCSRIYRWFGFESGIFNGIYDDWRIDAGIGEINEDQGVLTIDPKFMPNVEGKSPCHSRGSVTYGAIIDLPLITAEVASCWASILQDNPRSELVLGGWKKASPMVQSRLSEYFAAAGVLSRISFEQITYNEAEGLVVSRLKFLMGIDILLNPFPDGYNIEILDALWAGVPTITLAQKGGSCFNAPFIMQASGYKKFVAKSYRGYVRLAKDTAKSIMNDIDWRIKMHEKVKSTALFDQSKWKNNYHNLINLLSKH